MFELPEAGYAVGAKPIVADGDVTVDGTSRISFAGAAEMFAAHLAAERNGEYVLVENPEANAFVSDGAVEAAQTELGRGFRLYKRVLDGRNQLVLRVKAVPTGFMLIMR